MAQGPAGAKKLCVVSKRAAVMDEQVVSTFVQEANDMNQAAFEAVFGANIARENAQQVIEADVHMVQSGAGDDNGAFESAVAMRRLRAIQTASEDTGGTMESFLQRQDLQALSRMSQDAAVLTDPEKRLAMYKVSNPAFADVTVESIIDGKDKTLTSQLVRDWSRGSTDENRALVRLLNQMDRRPWNKFFLKVYILFSSEGEIDIYRLEEEFASKYAMEMPSTWRRSIHRWWHFALNDVLLTAFPFMVQYMMYRQGEAKVPSLVPGAWSMVTQGTSAPVRTAHMCNTRNEGELLDLPSSVGTVEGVGKVPNHTDAPGCMRHCDTNSECHMAQFEGGECFTLELTNPILTGAQLRTMFAPSITPATAASQAASTVMYKCDDSVSWRKNQLSSVYGCVDVTTGKVDQALNCAVDPDNPTDAQLRGSCYWPGECPAETPTTACTWDNCPPMDACKRACEAKNLNATPDTATHMWKDRLGPARIMTAVGCYSPADVSEEPLYYEPQPSMPTVNVGGDQKGMWPFVARENMGACVEGGCEINPRSNYNNAPACVLSGNRWMTATNMQKLSGCWRYMNVDASFSATSTPMQNPLFDSQIVPTAITDGETCTRKGYQWFGNNPSPYSPPGAASASVPQQCYGSKEECSIGPIGDTGMTTSVKVWLGLLLGIVGLGAIVVAVYFSVPSGPTRPPALE